MHKEKREDINKKIKSSALNLLARHVVFEDLKLRKYDFDSTDNSVTFKIQVED